MLALVKTFSTEQFYSRSRTEPVHTESESLAQKNESRRHRCSRDFHYYIHPNPGREERFRRARTFYILHATQPIGRGSISIGKCNIHNACIHTCACNCFLVVGLRRKYIIITPIIVLTIKTRSVKVILLYRCGGHTVQLGYRIRARRCVRAMYDFNQDDFFTDLYRQLRKKSDYLQ
uniref:Uncharacterized protein n=1 Tax=Trichogramma kaykai TaxID=54128 RepID=A0ABD2WYG4_9HYME